MYPSTQVNMVPLLHNQHRYYTFEMARIHGQLGKMYRKLAKIEETLTEREERALTRKDKKKLQWARSVTRSTVQKLEWQQASLQDYLRQCNDLIASYETSIYHLPSTPWTACLPTSPYPLLSPYSPYSPYTPSPWFPAPRVPHQRSQLPRPQYWDLSMLRERRRSSQNASSADSGFHEPSLQGHPPIATGDASIDLNHVFAHELIAASEYNNTGTDQGTTGTRSKKSSVSEKDDLPELPPSIKAAPAMPGAINSTSPTSPHNRRYSENAIQIIESRIAMPRTHQRGVSVGPVPEARRKSSLKIDNGASTV